MPENYAYRVRILFFVKRKKNAYGNTHAYLRMFGKRQYKTNQRELEFYTHMRIFYTHIRIFLRICVNTDFR